MSSLSERLLKVLRQTEEAVIRADETLLHYKRTCGLAVYINQQSLTHEIKAGFDSYHTQPSYGDVRGAGVRPCARLVALLPIAEEDGAHPDMFKLKTVRSRRSQTIRLRIGQIDRMSATLGGERGECATYCTRDVRTCA